MLHALSHAQMGLPTGFYDSTSDVIEHVNLSRLPRTGDMSIGAIDASIMLHRVSNAIFKSKSRMACHGRAVKKPCVLLRPELKRDFFDVRRVQCREQLWLYLEDANRQLCSKKIRKDQSLPELSMQSMWQLNWGNEVATEQKRSE